MAEKAAGLPHQTCGSPAAFCISSVLFVVVLCHLGHLHGAHLQGQAKQGDEIAVPVTNEGDQVMEDP